MNIKNLFKFVNNKNDRKFYKIDISNIKIKEQEAFIKGVRVAFDAINKDYQQNKQ